MNDEDEFKDGEIEIKEDELDEIPIEDLDPIIDDDLLDDDLLLDEDEEMDGFAGLDGSSEY